MTGGLGRCIVPESRYPPLMLSQQASAQPRVPLVSRGRVVHCDKKSLFIREISHEHHHSAT